MEKDKRFKPQNLRTVLSLFFFLIVAGGGALYYLGLTEVREYAHEVNQQIANAKASEDKVPQLQILKNQLATSTQLVEKANLLFSTPDAYRSRATTDIANYAAVTGLRVASSNFDNEDPTMLTVKLVSPVDYVKFIRFLSLIEGNLPKMQVISMSLASPGNGNPASVNVGDIKIKVSVRQ